MKPTFARLFAAVYLICGAIAFWGVVSSETSKAASSLAFLVLSLPWSLMVNMLLAIAGIESPILLRTVLALGIAFNGALVASIGRPSNASVAAPGET